MGLYDFIVYLYSSGLISLRSRVIKPMKKKTAHPARTIHVKNMTCSCCIHLLRKELAMDGIEIHDIKLGTLVLSHDPKKITSKKIETILGGLYGLRLSGIRKRCWWSRSNKQL